MPSASRLALFFVFVGCAHHPTEAERWFSERGAQAKSWDVCLRMGAELRAACNGDQACEERVTNELTFSCYAGRYSVEAGRNPPASALSPCFLKSSAEAYCEQLSLTPRLAPLCVAELRYLVEEVCKRGHVELTGAGP